MNSLKEHWKIITTPTLNLAIWYKIKTRLTVDELVKAVNNISNKEFREEAEKRLEAGEKIFEEESRIMYPKSEWYNKQYTV